MSIEAFFADFLIIFSKCLKKIGTILGLRVLCRSIAFVGVCDVVRGLFFTHLALSIVFTPLQDSYKKSDLVAFVCHSVKIASHIIGPLILHHEIASI